MVRIAGGDLDVFYPGFEHIRPIRLGDYLMDRFEVTNREFKRFVDSGGGPRRGPRGDTVAEGGARAPGGRNDTPTTQPSGAPGPPTLGTRGEPAGAGNH